MQAKEEKNGNGILAPIATRNKRNIFHVPKPYKPQKEKGYKDRPNLKSIAEDGHPKDVGEMAAQLIVAGKKSTEIFKNCLLILKKQDSLKKASMAALEVLSVEATLSTTS